MDEENNISEEEKEKTSTSEENNTTENSEGPTFADANADDLLGENRAKAQKAYENCANNMYRFLDSSVELTDQILTRIMTEAMAKAALIAAGVNIFAKTPEPVPTYAPSDNNADATAEAEAIANSGNYGGGGGTYDGAAVQGNGQTKGAFNGTPTEIAVEAWKEAQALGAKYNVNPALIYGQWYHETGGFTSDLMKECWNFGGLTQSTPNGNKQPDGSLWYMEFSSLHAYADYFGRIWLDYPEMNGMKDSAAYCSLLKEWSYYGDDYSNYLNGVNSGMNNLPSNMGLA